MYAIGTGILQTCESVMCKIYYFSEIHNFNCVLAMCKFD